MPKIVDILWPPPYYLLRDRIPFFFTCIYLYLYLNDKKLVKYEVKPVLREAMGYVLLWVTFACLFLSINFLIFEPDLSRLFGFKWSFASPIEWSIFVIATTLMLRKRNLPTFDAYYLSLLAGLGGGWLYEILYGIPIWIKLDFAFWNWLKVNAVKIFFIEFQVLSIPIILYILYTRYSYKPKNSLKYYIVGVTLWHFSNFWIAPYLHSLGTFKGNTLYAWLLRVPMMILLYKLLEGVDKQ